MLADRVMGLHEAVKHPYGSPMKIPAFVLALFMTISLPAAAQVQPPAPPLVTEDREIYGKIFDALVDASPREVVLGQMTAFYVRTLRGNPEFKRWDAIYPGYIDAIARAVRPVREAYIDRIRAKYRAQYAAQFQAGLSQAEAKDVLLLLQTPVLRRLNAMGLESFQGTASVRSSAQGRDVTAEDVQADMAEARNRFITRITAQDRQEIRVIQRNPTLQKFGRLCPDLALLQLQMTNEPYSAVELNKLDKLAREAADGHVASFAN